MNKIHCQDCRFFLHDGFCRRYPPRNSGFQRVEEDARICGEFKYPQNNDEPPPTKPDTVDYTS